MSANGLVSDLVRNEMVKVNDHCTLFGSYCYKVTRMHAMHKKASGRQYIAVVPTTHHQNHSSGRNAPQTDMSLPFNYSLNHQKSFPPTTTPLPFKCPPTCEILSDPYKHLKKQCK